MESSTANDGSMLSEQNNIPLGNEKTGCLSAGRKQILPPINSNIDKKGGMKDCLPSNLVATLTQACATFDDLGPRSAKHKGKAMRRRTDNVWHHEKTREKLKHLTEQPPCHCGAGSDISYLLDAAIEKSSEKSAEVNSEEAQQKHLMKNLVPESIIPSEFHVVKHKGAVGLEIYDEKYTTQTEGHEEHLTVFPSMKPSGRQEALQLMQTMNKLLKKAGVSDKMDTNETVEDVETSQIEKLLRLVKEEQLIYNIIFNEVIRQVSVECIERGAVLAELRKRYSKLLESVPKQVKSLHEEVLAQRALDRRLTEELSSFKTAITLLTKELHEIHAHDEEVTKQAVETQAELNEALKESEKNASLLAEYHDLYELQRRRLDYQLSKLIEERDLWAGSAHMLSLKVTEKHNLVTIRRLHLYEKAWYKLANNFAILLGHEDQKQLQVLAGHIHKWQEIVDSFNEKLLLAERASCERMQTIESSIAAWAKKFERVVTPDEGTVHPPESEYIQALFYDMKSWEDTFNKECERFMGDVLLSCEDDLLQLNKCVDLWIQTAVNIFRTHPTSDGFSHPQHVAMMELNTKVEKLHSDFKLRMSGENGVSKIFIQILNNLDSWINKVNTVMNGGETLFDSEWLQLTDLFQVQWKEAIHDVIKILSCDDEHEVEHLDEKRELVDDWLQNRSDVCDVYDGTQKWLDGTTSSIENEDSNIVEQVVNTHSDMVRWTITVLLRIAPDTESHDEPNGAIVEDSSTGLGAAILEESTSESIIDRAILLFNWLHTLTNRLVSCLKGVFAQKNKLLNSHEQESILEDLRNIGNECCGWMQTAGLLITEVTGETIAVKDFLPRAEIERSVTTIEKPAKLKNTVTDKRASNVPSLTDDIDKKNEMEVTTASEEDAPVEPVEQKTDQINMHIIGHDENVKKRRMMSMTEECPPELNASLSQQECTNQSVSLEELHTMELLQQQLMDTEKRAQSAEEKAFVAESALKEAEEKIRSLERSLFKMEKDGREMAMKKNNLSELKPDCNFSSIMTISSPSRDGGTPRNISSPGTASPSKDGGEATPPPAITASSGTASSNDGGGEVAPQIAKDIGRTPPPQIVMSASASSKDVADGEPPQIETVAADDVDVGTNIGAEERDAPSTGDDSNQSNRAVPLPGQVITDIEGGDRAVTSSLCSISPTLLPQDDPPAP